MARPENPRMKHAPNRVALCMAIITWTYRVVSADVIVWEDHHEPGDFIIRSGETVMLRGNNSVMGQLEIAEGGMLTVDEDQDVEFHVGNIDISGSFRIGNATTAYTGKTVVELACESKWLSTDERRKAVIVRSNGALSLHGNKGADGTAWTRLTDTTTKGATCLNVDLPNGWEVGDSIVLPSTDFDPHQTETRIITSISPECIEVDRPLEYMHYGRITEGVDERAEVGLLTRNIVFRGCQEASEENAAVGGHLQFMNGFEAVQIEGVELDNFGQGDELGRYPFHFGVCGRVPNGTYLRGNSIQNSNFRAITIHGTQGVSVEGNVVFNISGHAFMLEDGSESDNTMRNNLIVLVREKVSRVAIGSNLDVALSAIYISNTDNIISDNAIAAVEGTGLWIHTRLGVKGLSLETGLYDDVHPFKIPVREMRRNSVHSAEVGLKIESPDLDSQDFPQRAYSPPFTYMPDDLPIIQDFVVHHCRQGGWFRLFRVAMDNWTVGDVTEGIQVVTHGNTPDTLVETYVTNSRFVGGTANRGNLVESRYQFVNYLEDRSDSAINRIDDQRMGIKLYDGPMHISNSTFLRWFSQPCLDYYNPAIGTRQFNAYSMATTTTALGLTFEQTDLKLFVSDRSADGGKSTSMVDVDGSVSGYRGATLLPDWDFYVGRYCERRSHYGISCPHAYANLDVISVDSIRDPTRYGSLSIFRNNVDEDTNAGTRPSLTFDGQYTPEAQGWLYHPIVSTGASYTLLFTNYTPSELRLVLSNADAGSIFVLSVAYPASTQIYKVTNQNGDCLDVADSFASVSDAFNSSCVNCYYFDATLDLLTIIVVQDTERGGPASACPLTGCVTIDIHAAVENTNTTTADLASTETYPHLVINDLTDPWLGQEFLEEGERVSDSADNMDWCNVNDPCLDQIEEGNRKIGVLAYFESPCHGEGCYSSTCRYCKLSISSADVPFPVCPFDPNNASGSLTSAAGCSEYGSVVDKAVGMNVIEDSTCTDGGTGCITTQCRFCQTRSTPQSAEYLRCSDLSASSNTPPQSAQPQTPVSTPPPTQVQSPQPSTSPTPTQSQPPLSSTPTTTATATTTPSQPRQASSTPTPNQSQPSASSAPTTTTTQPSMPPSPTPTQMPPSSAPTTLTTPDPDSPQQSGSETPTQSEMPPLPSSAPQQTTITPVPTQSLPSSSPPPPPTSLPQTPQVSNTARPPQSSGSSSTTNSEPPLPQTPPVSNTPTPDQSIPSDSSPSSIPSSTLPQSPQVSNTPTPNQSIQSGSESGSGSSSVSTLPPMDPQSPQTPSTPMPNPSQPSGSSPPSTSTPTQVLIPSIPNQSAASGSGYASGSSSASTLPATTLPTPTPPFPTQPLSSGSSSSSTSSPTLPQSPQVPPTPNQPPRSGSGSFSASTLPDTEPPASSLPVPTQPLSSGSSSSSRPSPSLPQTPGPGTTLTVPPASGSTNTDIPVFVPGDRTNDPPQATSPQTEGPGTVAPPTGNLSGGAPSQAPTPGFGGPGQDNSCLALVPEIDLAAGMSAESDILCQFGGLGCFSLSCRYCRTRTTQGTRHLLPCSQNAINQAYTGVDIGSGSSDDDTDLCWRFASPVDLADGLTARIDPTCSNGGLGCLSSSCRFCRFQLTDRSASYLSCDEIVSSSTSTGSSASGGDDNTAIKASKEDQCRGLVSSGDVAVGITAIMDLQCGTVGGLGCFSDSCRYCKTRITPQSAHMIDCTEQIQRRESVTIDGTRRSDVVSSIDTCSQSISIEENEAGIFAFTDDSCNTNSAACFSDSCRYCLTQDANVTLIDQDLDMEDLLICPPYVVSAAMAGTSANEETSALVCPASVSFGDAQAGISAYADAACNAVDNRTEVGCFPREPCRFCKYRETSRSSSFEPCPTLDPVSITEVRSCQDIEGILGIESVSFVNEPACEEVPSELSGCIAFTQCRACQWDDSNVIYGHLPLCMTDLESSSGSLGATLSSASYSASYSASLSASGSASASASASASKITALVAVQRVQPINLMSITKSVGSGHTDQGLDVAPTVIGAMLAVACVFGALVGVRRRRTRRTTPRIVTPSHFPRHADGQRASIVRFTHAHDVI